MKINQLDLNKENISKIFIERKPSIMWTNRIPAGQKAITFIMSMILTYPDLASVRQAQSPFKPKHISDFVGFGLPAAAKGSFSEKQFYIVNGL